MVSDFDKIRDWFTFFFFFLELVSNSLCLSTFSAKGLMKKDSIFLRINLVQSTQFLFYSSFLRLFHYCCILICFVNKAECGQTSFRKQSQVSVTFYRVQTN